MIVQSCIVAAAVSCTLRRFFLKTKEISSMKKSSQSHVGSQAARGCRSFSCPHITKGVCWAAVWSTRTGSIRHRPQARASKRAAPC